VIIYYRSFLFVNACESTSTEAEAPNLFDEKTLILTKNCRMAEFNYDGR
jgi:hypothetical protein